MVIIGVIQTDVGQTFTGDFQELLVKCVQWVTDDYEVQIVNSLKDYNLLAGPNPTSGIVNVSLTLPVGGNVRANIYEIITKNDILKGKIIKE